MKFYIPFGDWSGDGHERYEKVLVEAESMKKLLEAENKIKAIYGEDFFEGYAEKCDNPQLAPKCWQALLDNNMPMSLLEEYDELNDWTDFSTLKEVLEEDSNPYVDLDFVITSFIFLLNQYGAGIMVLNEPYIPEINNWTCPGFKTVGYGCFSW